MASTPAERYTQGITNKPTEYSGEYANGSPFPWPAARIEEYTAYRTDAPMSIDGHLDEPAWQSVPRSPRFSDMISGARGLHDTRAAVLWDRDYLYVGYWMEEPDVQGDLTERDSFIFRNNDVEFFLAGRDAYYEFEINALGTIYEVFFIWDNEYDKVDYGQEPTLKKSHPQAKDFNGVGLKTHPRGMRTGFWGYDLPGLKWAVHVDGTLNDSSDRDRGWTVELALPWSGMKWLAAADNRQLPPAEGDILRMDFSRFNQYREAAPNEDSGAWFWSPHGCRDSHIPECFTSVRFTEELVPKDRRG
jgi:hypothetical protein